MLQSLKTMGKCFTILLCVALSTAANGWGFYAHKKINEFAVYTLPPEMMVLFKPHIEYLSVNAVNPDKRRQLIKDEPCKHYIDLDIYPDSIRFKMPAYWHQAIKLYPEDTLKKHGIVPWHVYLMKTRLTEAFKTKNTTQILKLAADIGHYIADANVPLHTTRNYNGQLSNQYGIHALWESRIPEIYGTEYNAMVGKPAYLKQPQQAIWEAVYEAHGCLSKVFELEQLATDKVTEEKKFSYEERNGQTVRVYSKTFVKEYNSLLSNMVEERFQKSIQMVSSFWYTAWVDAGEPSLKGLNIDYTEIVKDTTQHNHSAVDDCHHQLH